jgi:SAM-dependent methyltransferase
MTIEKIGGMGFAPTVRVESYNPEVKRYERAWERSEYRIVSPGEQLALTFLAQARPKADSEVIDFGCGTGRGGLMLAAIGSMRVTLVDFAANCLDQEVRDACEAQPERIKFHLADLTRQTLPFHAAYGYCCDVMEHVRPEDVPLVLRNILSSAQHVFFSISTKEDICGELISDGPLHLTIQDSSWWIDQLRAIGAVIHWQEERSDGGVSIYCTAWKDAADLITNAGKINTDIDVVDAQVRANIMAGWNHVAPYNTQDREVVLLAGGPSLNDCIDEIKELRAEGAGLVTVNGAYSWALAHGLEPSAQIVLDAREFNTRFVRPVTEYTKFLIASQCHPDILDWLPRERTWLWHSGLSAENEALVRERTGQFFPVPGGSTVTLRAIALLRMLGFKSLHIFGFDSCVRFDGAHHAYIQLENDNEPLVPVVCGGKTFQCTPWMLSQASEFRDMVSFLGDEVECAVYGDGLIAQMIKTGAEFSMQQGKE